MITCHFWLKAPGHGRRLLCGTGKQALVLAYGRVRFGRLSWARRFRLFGPSLGVRFDTVSYSDFAANFTDFRQLVRARSRLYRSRFLQPNTHFAAFFEIYKIIIPSHRSDLKICRLKKICKKSMNFRDFSQNSAEIF